MRAIVDAAHFTFVIDNLCRDRNAFGNRHRDDVGQVVLALRVMRNKLRDPTGEEGGRRGDEAGVDLVDRTLRRRRVAILDDRCHAARAVSHDAPEPARFGHARRQNTDVATPRMIDNRRKPCGGRERHVGQTHQRHSVVGHRLQRHARSIAGAARRLLTNEDDVGRRQRRSDAVGAIADHHDDRPW